MNTHNYNHFFYFYVTAKLKGVTLAAKHLNTSQSSLSTQIKVLENTLKKELFQKSGRQIELTEAGKELFNYCRRAFEIFDEMFDQLNKNHFSMGNRISIGVAVDIDRPFVTEALSKVSKQYAKEKRPLLNLVSLPSNQLIQLLKLGEIDLLLAINSGFDSELEQQADFSHPVEAFCTADFLPLLKKKTFEVALREGDFPLVLPSQLTGLRSEIDSYFNRKKVRPTCVFESNILASVVRAAVDGLGVTFLPRAYVMRELKTKKLVSVCEKPLWKHRMALLSHKRKLTSGRENFIEKLVLQLKESEKPTRSSHFAT